MHPLGPGKCRNGDRDDAVGCELGEHLLESVPEVGGRLEPPAGFDLGRLTREEELVDSLKKLGFDYVTVDLEGYRMGSMEGSGGGTGARSTPDPIED